MLTPIYTIPTLKIESDEQVCLANITVKFTDLSTAIGGREYMLPVRITNSGNDNIPIQEDAVCYFRIKLVAKWSGFWKNTIHADEYGLSTTPDNQYDIYLYSRADALKEIKDWSVLTALSKITDEEAIVCPGWSGTMIEQCSPIIKITNEDAGNGKLKVEILASWAYEVAAELTTTTSNNKSTYNPQTNEIHLDYTGSFSWGDFRFQRTFSGQIPN